MLSRRGLLAGFLASAPVVIASSHLMPLRGVRFDPIVRVQSWPMGENVAGPFWVQEGPLSTMKEPMREMMGMFGNIHYAPVERRYARPCSDLPEYRDPQAPLGVGMHEDDAREEWFGGGGVFRVGVAHGVTRSDGPLKSQAEFLREVRERYPAVCERVEKSRAEDPAYPSYLEFAAAHEARTRALIAQADAIRTFGIPDEETCKRLWKTPRYANYYERAKTVLAELGPPNPVRTRTRTVI